jgi:glycosyltransferase EpsF
LNIPEHAKIMLFVGTMDELKNPVFLVDILRHLLVREENAYAVFVGRGAETLRVLARAQSFGLSERIRTLNWRNDIPRIMKSADVFVFPRVEHIKEGLGLVIVEAQAAGLPVVTSRAVVEDAIIIQALAHFVPLKDNPKEWADKVFDIMSSPLPLQRSEALARMRESPFALKTATNNLLALYEE